MAMEDDLLSSVNTWAKNQLAAVKLTEEEESYLARVNDRKAEVCLSSIDFLTFLTNKYSGFCLLRKNSKIEKIPKQYLVLKR